MLDVRMVKEQEKFSWPENYYMEIDGKLREEYYDKLVKLAEED